MLKGHAQMTKTLTVQYENLNSDNLRNFSSYKLKIIKDGIDFYFTINLKENNKNAVVVLKETLDSFNDNSNIASNILYKQFNANCILLYDISIRNTKLDLGWGVGTPENYYLLEYSTIIKTILELLDIKDNNTVYFGKDSAAFMAMGMGTLHKNSHVVVDSPVFFPNRIDNGVHIKRLFKEKFKGITSKDIYSNYPERFSVTSLMKKVNYYPPITIIQNKLNINHMSVQILPFFEMCDKYNINIEKIEILYFQKAQNIENTPYEKILSIINAKFNTIKKNLLILLHSLSDHNGLHDNVFQTAIESRKRGYNVFVAHREGEFLDKLRSAGFNVIACDFSNTRETINQITSVVSSKLNLIHVHPGKSRKIGLLLKKELKVPIVMTIHGKWTDSISQYYDRVDAIFAVSEGIKQKIIEECDNAGEKVHVIPNYSKYDHLSYRKKDNDVLTISFITRLDKDKELILNEVKKIIPSLNEYKGSLAFNVIGDGSLKDEFEKYFKSNINNNNIKINFVGWVSEDDILRNYYVDSDLIIGPGRIIIDSFTLNRAAIVIGSKLYEGIMDRKNWQKFVSSNFGGYRKGGETSTSEIVSDFEKLVYSPVERKKNQLIGSKVVNEFFNSTQINKKHFTIYDLIEK